MNRSTRLRRGLVGISAALAAVAAQLVAVAPVANAAVAYPKVLDGAVEALETIGDIMFVGGSFSKIELADGSEVVRPGIFAYDMTTGALNAFDPVLNDGAEVLAIEASDDGSAVFLGGDFQTVNGAARYRLAKIDLNGDLVGAFSADVSAKVNRVQVVGQRVFVGGNFATVGGQAHARLAEVDATTGAANASFTVDISGVAALGGWVNVQGLCVNPAGDRMIVTHNGTAVAGTERYGVAILDISTSSPTVTGWHTTLWKDNLARGGGVVRTTDCAWAPDGSWFVISNSGGDAPPVNDSVQRFEFGASGPVEPTWVTRHYDSVYSVAVGADDTVYSGGHFRYVAAPGSMDPWPGLDDVNYGFGTDTGGAVVLGDQVVERGQLTALDPTTGKAMNWYHSANGQHGITALKYLPGGQLALGHDGVLIDLAGKGRHGIVDAYDAPRDASKPSSTLTSPLAGASIPGGATTLSGTATAAAGVQGVQVEIKQNGKWLSPTGGLVTTYTTWDAALTSPGATETTWSLQVPLDSGSYQIWPKAKDSNGVGEPVRWWMPVHVVDFTNSPPVVAMTSPEGGSAAFTSSTVTFTGTAQDQDGVRKVALSFYNRTAQKYLSAPDTLGDYTSFDATLSPASGTNVEWSFTTTLPDGEYHVFYTAVDARGARRPRPLQTGLTMSPNNVPPTVLITAPKEGDKRPSTVKIKGTASDEDGVKQVLVAFFDQRFRLGVQPGGTWGKPGEIAATLTSPGAKTTEWIAEIPNVGLGEYTATAVAVDNSGVRTARADKAIVRNIQRRPPGYVYPHPQGFITGPKASTFKATDLSIPLTGKAKYQNGMTHIRLYVKNEGTNQWLNDQGTTQAEWTYYRQFKTQRGTSITWKHTLNLPSEGIWRVEAVAVGGSEGNVDWSPRGSRAVYRVFPSDAEPTVEWNAPTNDSIVNSSFVSAGGRAFDDRGVVAVRVQLVLYNRQSKGLRKDGTIGEPEWLDATISNPGGDKKFTNWSFVSSPLGNKKFLMRVNVIDSNGQGLADIPQRAITING